VTRIAAVTFVVPELARHPILGAGCCALASEWLIETELRHRVGILEVHADDRAGEVAITYDGAETDAWTIESELAELGFPSLGTIPQK